MSPKRNDDVPPPAVDGEWHIRFGTNDACAGWQELTNKAKLLSTYYLFDSAERLDLPRAPAWPPLPASGSSP